MDRGAQRQYSDELLTCIHGNKRTDNLIDGVKLADELISDGSVKDWLNRVKNISYNEIFWN